MPRKYRRLLHVSRRVRVWLRISSRLKSIRTYIPRLRVHGRSEKMPPTQLSLKTSIEGAAAALEPANPSQAPPMQQQEWQQRRARTRLKPRASRQTARLCLLRCKSLPPLCQYRYTRNPCTSRCHRRQFPPGCRTLSRHREQTRITGHLFSTHEYDSAVLRSSTQRCQSTNANLSFLQRL